MTGSQNNNRAVLKAVRAIVGPRLMADLYAEKGGTEVWFPRECDADHWMSRILGEEIANKVCERFTVMNADGKVIGNVRCYFPIQNSRIALLHQQIEEEVKQALIAGKAPNNICHDIGISVRKVRDHLKMLREHGVLPTPEKRHVSPARTTTKRSVSELRRTQAEKRAKVDEMLIAGRTNRNIIIATGLGVHLVRQRRKHLLDAGKLHIGSKVTVSHPLYSRPDSVADAIGHVVLVGDPDEVSP